MGSIGSVIFLLLVVSVVSLGAAFLLDVAARGLSLTKRSLAAGLIGGFLPMAIPLAVVLIDAADEAALVVLVLIILTLILSLVIGFPVAYFFSRKRERARGDAVDPKVFE